MLLKFTTFCAMFYDSLCVPCMGKQCTQPEALNKFKKYKFISISKRRGAKYTRGLKSLGSKIYLFLRDKLRLPINREKSGIRRPVNFSILGYGFVPTYQKGVKGQYQLIVEKSRWKQLKAKLKKETEKPYPAGCKSP